MKSQVGTKLKKKNQKKNTGPRADSIVGGKETVEGTYKEYVVLGFKKPRLGGGLEDII